MSWLMSRPTNPEAVASSKIFRVCSLPRSQPIPTSAGMTQMMYSAKNVATVSSACSDAPVR